jgi:hypothetical protein
MQPSSSLAQPFRCQQPCRSLRPGTLPLLHTHSTRVRWTFHVLSLASHTPHARALESFARLMPQSPDQLMPLISTSFECMAVHSTRHHFPCQKRLVFAHLPTHPGTHATPLLPASALASPYPPPPTPHPPTPQKKARSCAGVVCAPDAAVPRPAHTPDQHQL